MSVHCGYVRRGVSIVSVIIIGWAMALGSGCGSGPANAAAPAQPPASPAQPPASPAAPAVAKEQKGRWDPAITEKLVAVEPTVAAAKGCLSCHSGIEAINAKMQPFLLAFAGGKEGFECAVCHEGRPAGATKAAAHEGLLPNPSSMWVMNDGRAVRNVTAIRTPWRR